MSLNIVSKYILRGGLVIDPKSGTEKKLDILIDNGRIVSMKDTLLNDDLGDIEIIDISGKIVAPGFIDMHVHLREPGGEANETILTGCQAAARGGFTHIAPMPNTDPCADNEGVIELIKARAKAANLVKVLPIGTISKGREGKEMAEIGSLHKAGAVAVSDDGSPVVNSEVMRRALEYTKIFGLPVISHSEDLTLVAGGVMHEGYWSTVLGLKGIPAQAEECMVARDILLAGLTGGKLHLAHVSTKGSAALLEFAKSQGINVTAEVTPHHLYLTDEAVQGYDTSTKVNPPLRSKEHVESVRNALKEGYIQCIATDHAPWANEEKEQEYNKAKNGISGLETAIPVCWDTLVKSGFMSPLELIEKFTINPAEILNIDAGYLEEGVMANITVIDPDIEKEVKREDFYSKGKNSPLDGQSFTGWPVMTIVDGEIIMQDGIVKER